MAPDESAAKYIHWGATTQGIMDNASVLQIRAGLGMVETRLEKVASALKVISIRDRHTPTAGRTHLQHTLPSTFGYKCVLDGRGPPMRSTSPIQSL